MPIVTNGQMIDAITKLENKNYKAFCDQADELAGAAHTDVRRNATLYPLWEEWRLQHNALVDEYDKLKRESRFGPPLYRPQLPSRWSDKIDQLPQPIAGSY